MRGRLTTASDRIANGFPPLCVGRLRAKKDDEESEGEAEDSEGEDDGEEDEDVSTGGSSIARNASTGG